jgi:hypothetical protein
MTTATTGAPPRLGTLILTWLLTQPMQQGTRSKLDWMLKAILDKEQWSDQELRRVREETLGALLQAGLLARKKKTAFGLTKRGLSEALEALGVESLPERIGWKKVKKVYLLARGLGLPPPATPTAATRMGSINGIRAALLSHHYGLAVGAHPSLTQVRDALGWRELGVDSKKPFSVTAALTLLLNRTLGAEEPLELDEVLEQLAAKAAGVHRAEVDDLQRAALSRWLDTQEGPSGAEGKSDRVAGQIWLAPASASAPGSASTPDSASAIASVSASLDGPRASAT